MASAGQPELWTETDTWAEVARLAGEQGLRLEITHGPERLNPFVRLVAAPPGAVPEGHPGLTPSAVPIYTQS